MSTTGDVIFLVFAFLAVVAVSEVLARKGAAWGLVAKRDLAVGLRIPTAGGLGFLPGLIAALVLVGLLSGNREWLVLAGATLLLSVVGFIDDVMDLRPAIKLVAEVLICGVAVWVWVGLEEPTAWLCLVMIVATINLVNFADNMDGLAATLTATTAAGVLTFTGSNHDISPIVPVVIAVCAAFMLHNRPPARVHMGDTGSMGLGFVLGLLLAGLMMERSFVPTASSAAVVGLLLGVMLLDGVQVIAARAIIRRPIMPGDRRHLSHRLLKIVGSKWRTLGILGAVHAVFVAGAVVVVMRPALWAIVVAPLALGGVALVAWLWKVPGDEYPEGPPPATAAP